MAGPQLGKDEAGNIWELDAQGNPVRLHSPAQPAVGPAIGGNPMIPGQLQGQALNNQKNSATLPYEVRKAAADASSAEIAARTAKENYDNAHVAESPQLVGLSGPALLAKLPADERPMIQGMLDGRMAPPTASALKDPQWQQRLKWANQVDPSFDESAWSARVKGRSAIVGGTLGKSQNALNTAIGHAASLMDLIPQVASHGPALGFLPTSHAVNAIQNAYERQNGEPGISQWDYNANQLANELEAAYTGGQGSEQGRTRQLESLNPNMSADQKQAVIHKALDLLASKVAANYAQYSWAFRDGKPTWDMLDPDARAALKKYAPDVLAAHFAAPAGSGDAGNSKGGAVGPSGNDPNGGPPPVSPVDFSGMTGGPGASLAQLDPNSKLGALKQTYRNEYDPVMAGAISALIKKGAPFETAATFAQSHGFMPPDASSYAKAVEFAQKHHGATNVGANRLVPTTFGERVASSPGAAFLAGATSAGTAGLLDTGGRVLGGPAFDANRAALAATHPGADLAGNVIGGAGAMIGGGSALSGLARAGAKGGLSRNALALALRNPVKAGAIGDTLYGGVYGANEDPGDPMTGAGIGALGGMFGSFGGAGLAKGAGGVMRGVTNPAVQRLRAAGVPLTVGEVLGGGAKKAQDALTSVFGPGNMVARRYTEGREALNRAAFNQAGDIIGAPINAVGQRGIQALDAAKSKAYADALDPVSINLANPQTIGDIGSALQAGRLIPNVDQASEIATDALGNYIGNAAPNGTMSGPDFQQAYRGLARTARTASNRMYGHEIGQVMGRGQDALVGALEDQHPGAYTDFLKANSANRHLSVLTDAVNSAKNQLDDNGNPLFTPAQLGTAATNNARTYSGKVAAASGQRPFNQLANDAQQVMSSKLPESGTIPRAVITGALMSGGGMFGGKANGANGAAEGALTPLALLTLLGTRRGQKLLTSSLLDRSMGLRAAGHAFDRQAPLAGSLVTATDVPFLTGQ